MRPISHYTSADRDSTQDIVLCFCFNCVYCCYLPVSSTVPKWVHQALAPVVVALEKYIPPPYAGEIRGMASLFGGSLSDIVILNFAYEISAYV